MQRVDLFALDRRVEAASTSFSASSAPGTTGPVGPRCEGARCGYSASNRSAGRSFADVADQPLQLALGLHPVGTARTDAEAPVVREAQNLWVLYQLPPSARPSSMMTAFILSTRISAGTPAVWTNDTASPRIPLPSFVPRRLQPYQPRVAGSARTARRACLPCANPVGGCKSVAATS